MTKPLAFIIEDDPDLSVIFATSLEEAGYQVESYDNGPDALKRMETTVPKVITLDLHLPIMSGREILAEIRARQSTKNCIVLITTADNQMANSITKDADFVLIKPISYKQLRDIAIRLKPTD